nr:hypothetical protein [Tanacetum cinerariifolium]
WPTEIRREGTKSVRWDEDKLSENIYDEFLQVRELRPKA